METSSVVEEWREQGRVQGRKQGLDQGREVIRAFVIDTLKAKLSDPVPEDVRQAVSGESDFATLTRWVAHASTAATIEAFRNAIKSKS